MPTVTLVIPGRNCARTIGPCLAAVVPLREREGSPLREIIFVDDGSTDGTRAIVERYPVTLLSSPARGAGAARNAGWRAARHPLIWFLDADCVVEADALDRLLPHLEDETVAAAGGSYGNMNDDSLLACLIHEEIVERHRAMPARVDFLASFNLLYRRAVLEELGGFDARFMLGQDADLAWRTVERGHALAFEITSRVNHFHPVSWGSYLHKQARQGFWRVWLHLTHRGRARNAYSGAIDHLQPPLALLVAASLPLAALPGAWWMPAALLALLAAAQLPMTIRIAARLRRPRYLAFAPLGLVRAFWRAAGMAGGVVAAVLHRPRPLDVRSAP